MGLDIVHLVLDVEQKFDIEISNEDAEKMITVGDLAHIVARLLSKKTGREVDYRENLQKLFDIIIENTGVDRSQLHLDASFVYDLGLD